MKKILWVLFIGTAFLMLCSTIQAEEFLFHDNVIYWESWGNGQDDTIDSIGSPNVIGGGGIVLDDDGNLDSVYFSYLYYNSIIGSGDLFVDIGQDKYWDYVVTPRGDIYMFAPTEFSLLKSDNEAYYITSTVAFGSVYSGYGYREDHPVFFDTQAVGVTYSVASWRASFSGFTADKDPVEFSDLGIDLKGQGFAIGWAPTCANDVVYAKVPEPTTALLFGFGLIGISAVGRKRYFK